jgi:hypothetical protein
VGLTETSLSSETSAGEAAEFDATEKFETEKLVEILKIHKVGLSCCQTISFCKTNIKRIIRFTQYISEYMAKF